MERKRPAEQSNERRTRIKLTPQCPEGTSQSDVGPQRVHEQPKTEVASNSIGTSSSPTELPSAENEVASPQINNMKLVVSADSSEDELQNSKNGSDNALLADTSEENPTSPTSNSDVDPGLPRSDYLDFEKCVVCKTDKKNISYPYCISCYKFRKNLFPERPKKKKKSGRGVKLIARHHARKRAKRTSYFQNRPDGNGSEALSRDSGIGSSGSQLSEDTVDGPLEPSRDSPDSLIRIEIRSCRVCYIHQENGLFVHLTSAHLYGCYSCAKEIWRNSGRCPLCRRRVYKITKLFC